MKSATEGPMADSIDLYLAHKRSLGKQLATVEPMLRLLDGYLLSQGVAELPSDHRRTHRRVRSLPAASISAQLQRAHRCDSWTVRLDGGSRSTA